MRLCELLKAEKVWRFCAVKLSECKVIKPRLISAAPDGCFAVMLTAPYPYMEKDGMSFASFARIPDYHGYFASLGEKASALIGERYGSRYVAAFSDHSPIDERHAAALCGLGVIGDNGLLVTEGYGSFVFIGEIIAELSASELSDEGIPVVEIYAGKDSPSEGCVHCGRCRAACPAGCIGGDKSLCVSALTQKKGALTAEEESIIRKSGYVWGCDRCAEVCPYFTIKDGEYPEAFTENVLKSFSWSDIEKMSETEYSAYPFSWRKKDVLKRNFDIYGKDGGR